MSFSESGFIREIKYYESLASTNLTAKKLASEGACEGTLVMAGKQTDGRGRTGSKWHHPEKKGDAIAMSMILRPKLAPDSASMLTIAAAVAVRRAIEKETGLAADIKWPNDLLCGGKKLCGILTEGVFRDGAYYAVLGIGLNVNAEAFPKELEDTACSIKQCTGKKTDSDRLVRAIFEEFENSYAILQSDGNLRRLRDGYNASCTAGSEIDDRGQRTKAFDNIVAL